MMNSLLRQASPEAVPVTLLTEASYDRWLKLQPARVVNWLKAHDFKLKPGRFCVLPDDQGRVERVVAGLSDPVSLWDVAALPRQLPMGAYRLDGDGEASRHEWLALGWALGAYRYDRYKKSESAAARLVVPIGVDFDRLRCAVEAMGRTRDLINTTAADLGPQELAAAVVEVAKAHGAEVAQIIGDDLIKENYPAIHAVGRGSPRAPRLIDLRWGNPQHPSVTLVGKGVCFDTGGLDLKPPSAMYTMKKDMGGAAVALGVAAMVMGNGLPVRLRLLIPAVENSVSGDSFRPSDVIRMRNGLTVEVGNTDAEGRLVLADALAEAATENPELLIDFATLTGAARSAVGTEIAALFANDDRLAADLLAASAATEDPLWRMPLHKNYDRMLDSSIADLNSCPDSPYAGAITAALFLQRFIGASKSWAHLDFMAWNPSSKPGRPEGGEAGTLRTVYKMIEQRTKMI